jgi:hypothetical protein
MRNRVRRKARWDDPPLLEGSNAMTTTTIVTGAPARSAKPWYKVLYVQVLIAIVLGALVGWLWPALATNDWI